VDEYDSRACAIDVVVEVGSRNREPTLSVHVRIVVESRLFAGVAQALPRVLSTTRPINDDARLVGDDGRDREQLDAIEARIAFRVPWPDLEQQVDAGPHSLLATAGLFAGRNWMANLVHR
jgi:hypothetical protein